MKITPEFKKKISSAVVRIRAESIDINWNLPYIVETPTQGQGTGFFIDKSGIILTCSHVVDSAKNVFIEIPSESSNKYPCEVIGICPVFDIALIKTIDYKPKYTLSLGDSFHLKSGDEVYVVGYPMNYHNRNAKNINNIKFTQGIISGQQYGLIQTDSAINPGNSGGPLLLGEKVIGINSRKLIGQNADSIGYAVPIHWYFVIKNDFGKEKIIRRPQLGFRYSNTTNETIQALTKKKEKNGVIISQLKNHCLFKKNGIKENDIIVQWDKYKIDNYGIMNKTWIGSPFDLSNMIQLYSYGDKISFQIFHENKKKEIMIKIEKTPHYLEKKFSVFENIDYIIFGGMVFMDFCWNHVEFMESSKLLTQYNKYKEINEPKVILSFIFPNSPMQILNNLKTSDLISKVNDIKVNSLVDMRKALKKCLTIDNKKYIKIENDDQQVIYNTEKNMEEINELFANIYKYPLHKK